MPTALERGTLRAPQADLELADWRRRIGDLYRLQGEGALQAWRRGRDELFATHPQSPIAADQRASFTGLNYFDADAEYLIRCSLEPVRPGEDWLDIDTGGEDGVIRYRRSGTLRFELHGVLCELTVFAMTGYGGGLFLPFKDATSDRETYGGGRYLFDTVKNTDGLSLEMKPGSVEVMLDFNYAYNPSCAYDDRWACPLAPRENWLTVPIRAAEKSYR
jgi:uncharacterized protein (DUF1684 family)